MAVSKVIGELHTFNTGRLYSREGQPITWAVVDNTDSDTPAGARCARVVLFQDHARMISGSIPLFVGNMELINDRWVLNAYDTYHYRDRYDVAEVFKAHRSEVA